MKKLVLLFALVAFAATGAFAQTVNPADVCPGNNAPAVTSGAFTINVVGTATGAPLAFASSGTNDEGVCGLVTVEYHGGVEVSCNGASNGSITVNITGGNFPYRYTLYSSSTSATGGFTQHAQAVVNTTSNTFTGLPGDTWYYVTVEQTNGTAGNYGCLIATNMPAQACNAQAIYLDQPEKVTATYCQVPDYCQDNTASVTLNIQGGVQFYTVTWNAGTSSTTSLLAQPGAAAYSTTPFGGAASGITGQASPASTVGAAGQAPTAGITASDNGASGQDHDAYDNAQTVTITGLTGNYPYTFTITDANGCVVENP
ncbi:MAG TPA: SprB repeat-containing protein [Chitinophagales bacterium]|nr:SprB repeat-containing protein [Chitinophagales bacterium]